MAQMLVSSRWNEFDTARQRDFHYVSHFGQPRHGARKSMISGTSNVLESSRTVSVRLDLGVDTLRYILTFIERRS